MDVSRILAEIDAQISKLQQARELLTGSAVKSSKGSDSPKASKGPGRPKGKKSPGRPKGKKGPGRPKGSKNTASVAAPDAASPRKRNLSPEGRKKIADAMKQRWVERKKLAAAK